VRKRNDGRKPANSGKSQARCGVTKRGEGNGHNDGFSASQGPAKCFCSNLLEKVGLVVGMKKGNYSLR